ncbi:MULTISPECIES: transposase [Nitrosomonas]|uniref:transposase n=1 Tax=Nitrosomonas TaxID=914 RepID=UPI0019102EF9
MGYAGFFVQNPACLHNRLGQRDVSQTGRHQNHVHQCGDTLEYLPSYSPDFNHIEPIWAQAKAIRRREGCSVEQLFAGYEI